GLIDGGDRNCTIGEISALRRLVFESQTLMIAQIKATVEGKSDEGATELAPAEREDRMKRQAERLRGLSLEGELECGYAGYDTVMKMLQDNAALTRRALCLDLVGYRQVDVVQILKADQRAWLRLSEMVKSGLLETDPQVCFQLLPLPSGAAPKRERPAESPSESRPSKKS
ncbi:unnamed protein product, partial [Effrenium voratum]